MANPVNGREAGTDAEIYRVIRAAGRARENTSAMSRSGWLVRGMCVCVCVCVTGRQKAERQKGESRGLNSCRYALPEIGRQEATKALLHPTLGLRLHSERFMCRHPK